MSLYSRSFSSYNPELSCPTLPSSRLHGPGGQSESHTAKATIATGCIESDHVMIGGHGDVYSQNPTCLTCRSAQAGAEKKLYANSDDWIPKSNTRSKSVLNNRNLPLPPAIL